MPRRRWFVGAYLGLFVAVALAEVNLWPLTGWRLFSTLRGPTQSGWEAVVVGPSGEEAPLPFGRLPRGYRGALHVLQGFPSLSYDERTAVCRAWADGVRSLGEPVAGVRVYRTRSTVSLDGSPPTTATVREWAYSC